MSKLPSVKLTLGDEVKPKSGKGTAAKKIHRKITKKLTNAVGQLSAKVGNAPEVHSNLKVQQKALRTPKQTVKKSITPSVVKKSSAQKLLVATTERTPISRQKSKPTKKRSVGRDPNSMTTAIDGTVTKRTKLVKRVPKSTPTTTTSIAAAASHRLDGTKPTKPAVKRTTKGVIKRVLKKKLESSLNGKIAGPKIIDSIAVENLMPVLSSPRIHRQP